MSIILTKADKNDIHEIYDMQIKCFQALLNKYQDYDLSPGAERVEQTMRRMNTPSTDFYFISLYEKHIGVLRICDFKEVCKLKQIFILPEFQGYGYAQKAILLAETLYPNAESWELDTIKQEEKLCYLYEKLGYAKTEIIKHIKDGMDIIFFVKKITKT